MASKRDLKIPLFASLIVLVGCLIPLLFQKGYSSANTFEIIGVLFSGFGVVGVTTAVVLQKRELTIQRKELSLQRNELSLQREALEHTAKEFSIQNDTLNLQRFESTVFQMISLHHEIIDKLIIIEEAGLSPKEMVIEIQNTGKASGKKQIRHEKRDGFDYLKSKLIQELKQSEFPLLKGVEQYEIRGDLRKELNTLLENTCYAFFSEHGKSIGHYMRNLTQLFKIINESDFDYDTRQFYFDIVTSQLSNSELLILRYYMITEDHGFPYILYVHIHFDILPLPLDELHISRHHATLLFQKSDEVGEHIRLAVNGEIN